MSSLKNTEKLLGDAIENIEVDRASASKLLTDIMLIMSQTNDSDTHKKLGEVAARYLETLQRSNEQLVKLAAISGKMVGAKQGLSKDDINSIYDEMIGGREGK